MVQHPAASSRSSRSSRTARSARAFVLLLALAAVALVGCIRAEIAIRVNEDGSGEISVLTAVDAELFGELGAGLGGGEDVDPFSDLNEADLPPGASVEEYDEDGFTGVRITLPFDPGDDLARSIDQALTQAGGDDTDGLVGSDGAFDSFSLVREGEGWRFDATVAPVDDADEGADALGGALFESLFSEASVEIKLSLPGDLIEHNADRVDGGTLVWELELGSTEPRQIMALSGASDGGSNALVIVIAVVVLLAIAAGVVWRLASVLTSHSTRHYGARRSSIAARMSSSSMIAAPRASRSACARLRITACDIPSGGGVCQASSSTVTPFGSLK